ncbi:hypothetical protein OH807_01065 [Kitasatospora sp. NBC_01560]|uniref:hypothetical protein n=1 Tax=Kitasatospora sp. NBC_01560 TaxID=2975965 RepID=UPI00386F4131
MALFGSIAVVVGLRSAAPVDLSASYQNPFLPFLAVDLVLGFIVATRAQRASTVASWTTR